MSSSSTAADKGEDAMRRALRNAVVKAVKSQKPDALTRLIADGAPLNDKIAKSVTPLILAATKSSVHIIKLLIQGGASVIATNDNGETALQVAVRSGQVRVANYLINAGSSVNATNGRGETLLHVAASKGLREVQQLLIDKGALIEARNAYGETPLHSACFKGELACARLLVEAGASLETENTYKERPLHSAAFNGYSEIVCFFIKKNADINARNSSGLTPLASAASKGHVEIVQLLSDHGATVNEMNNSGLMPLHSAALNGDVDIVNLLVSRGADIDAKTTKGETALLYAAGIGHVGILTALIYAGASIDATNGLGETALHCAVNKGHLKAAMLLVNRGAPVNARNFQGMTPLYHAAFHGNTDLVKMLIQERADVNAAIPSGQTPLFAASKCGHVDVVTALIDAKAAVNIVNSADESPLVLAARAGHFDCVKILIRRGASTDAVGSNGKSALFGALSHGHIDIIKFLVEEGASIEKTNAHGEAPLHVAVFKNRTEVVQLLIDVGASLRSKNERGETPLHIAAFKGLVEMARLLIDQDAVVNAVNEHGETPLIVAAGRGYLDVVQLLIKGDASIQKKNMHGETALHAAASGGHFEVIEILLEAGAAVDIPSKKLRTPLYFAASGGHTRVVQFLIEKGASVNAVNSDGENALVAAARGGNFDIVKLLVTFGASVNVRGIGGETPLTAAAHWKRLDVIQLLIESDCFVRADEPNEKASLISRTLEAIRLRSAAAHEFLLVYELVIARLEDIWRQFCDASESLQSKLLVYAKIIYRFSIFMEKLEKMDVIDRLITSRKVTSSAKDFHQEIDHLMIGLGMDPSSQTHSGWPELWEEHRVQQVDLFKAVVEDNGRVASNLEKDADKIEAITLLRYELGVHRHKYSGSKLDLMENLLDKVVCMTRIDIPQPPVWFLPRHEIDDQEIISGVVHTSRGSWLNADVTIYFDSIRTQEDFEQNADMWYKLSHPNVIKLFGACQIGQPRRYICEYASDGNLRDYLQREENCSSMWQKLYEVALGLQYLHERSVVHGRLQCKNVLVGSDRQAKIAGFQKSILKNCQNLTKSGQELLRWKSPEFARGEADSYESDVYSLGMCIIEAVSGEIPWSSEPPEYVHFIVRRGWSQARPEGMSWDQWDLVKKMSVFDRRKRAKMGYIVERLKHFAVEEKQSKLNQSQALPFDRLNLPTHRSHCEDLSGYLIPELCATFTEALERIEAKCRMLTEAQEVGLHVHDRLANIYSQLLLMGKQPSDVEVAKFCTLLLRFQRYLRTPTSDLSAIRMAKSRKAAEAGYIFHGDIDKLLDILGITDIDPVHKWEHLYQDFSKIHHGNEGALWLKTTLNGESMDSESTTESGFTLTDSSSAGNSICFNVRETAFEGGSQTLNTPSSAPPPWFLSMSELYFDELDRIGEGSFGAVYRGTWLDTPVVVKFMGYEDDDPNQLSIFIHEAEIWHQLNHPHVAKLFGACHVGKRFFVCEYAANGTLSGYLRKKADPSVCWRKLYEVGMGLQYLHELSIIHNDMKCDNILIGSDDKAKVTDFGLSCTPDHIVNLDPKQMGALQWKAPEILVGEAPSSASDIYGFAMCIIEAVKGDTPWGRTADVMVRLQVRKGKLPPRPELVTDEQWSLIEMMCAADSSRRVKISFVLEKLKEISELDFDVSMAP